MNEAFMHIKRCEEADFLPTIFGKFRNEAITGALPVVLFGAGFVGKELLAVFKVHGVEPICFCDNDPSRAGGIHAGLPIISISELGQKHKESLIVVTVGEGRDAVKRQIGTMVTDADKILTIDNQQALIYYTQIRQWYWPEEDLLSNKDVLQQAYNLLEDQKSRDVFASKLALVTGGTDYRSFRNFIQNLADINVENSGIGKDQGASYYLDNGCNFDNDLIVLGDNELLVDGGAFTGDSALEFMKLCSRKNVSYLKIICYEPDPLIYSMLEKNMAPHANIELRPFGLWSHSGELSFADTSLLALGCSRIVSASEEASDMPGEKTAFMKTPVTSIDKDLPNEQVTLIKMDIEGAEIEALQGAVKTIERCRPKLVISAYHKNWDIFEILLLINQIAPEYKLYMRHFSDDLSDTVVIAIPTD